MSTPKSTPRSTEILVHQGAEHRLTGATEPGESWAAAARRVARDEVWPVDLSGEVKEFTVRPRPWVSLRPMTRGDLPLLTRWLAAEHVAAWFGADGEPTPERVAAHYGPAVEGEDTARVWIVEAQGRSVGFVQDYRIGDEPATAGIVPVGPEAYGVDYLIGEPAWVGRGLGTRMLWAQMAHLHARHPEVDTLFAAPDHRNAASLRVLAKLGYDAGTWFDERQPDGSVATLVGCRLDVGRVLA